jgi:hypothetical protein
MTRAYETRLRETRRMKRNMKRSILVLPLTFLASLAFISSAAAQGDLAVVVNSGNPAANISRAELRKVLSGDQPFWPGGARVKIILRAPGCRERTALLQFLRLSESEFKQRWTAQVVRGEVDTEPFVAPSIGMVLEAVRALPGAVSLVSAADLKPGMKVIKVDGLLPGAPGYPLH